MPMYDGNYYAPLWLNDQAPPIDETELRAMSNTIQNSQILSGSLAPTTTTPGTVGQKYVYTGVTPNIVYECVSAENEVYEWQAPQQSIENLAQAYSASATYAAGAYAIYGGVLYRALTDIETPETWTANHWERVYLANAVSAHVADQSNPHKVSAVQIGALEQTAVAFVESGSVASENHAVNDWIILSGTLYEVTEDIVAGDSMIVGTNIEPVVLGNVVSGHIHDTDNPHQVTAVQIGAATAGSLAPVETAETASQAYSSGDYLTMGGVLYIVTSDIDQGDTITVGDNVEVSTVAEGLAGKQTTLTFDAMPTIGSSNPVTSGGVYSAVGVAALMPMILSGDKAQYRKAMKRWFLNNGANAVSAVGLTALCGEWYRLTRVGWNGWTTFAQPDVSTVSTGVKGGDNAGLVCVPSTATAANQDDYQGLPLFAIVDVNWELDQTSGDILVTAIDGITSNFVRNDPDVYVGVMQQTGYHYWADETESYYHGYTDQYDSSLPHCRPLPEAVRLDGTVREFVVHGKYMASLSAGNKLTCCAEVIPTAYSITHDSLLTYSANNGDYYSGGTIVDWSFLYLMTLIKYGSMTQDGVNQGCIAYNYQYAAAVSETGVSRVLVTTAQGGNLMVGSTVLVGNSAGNTDRGQAAMRSIGILTIASIESVTIGGTTYSAVNLDTDSAFDTTAGTTYISTFHWATGYCDTVSGNDGSPINPANGKEPAMIQGIECSVGGNEVFADVILSYVNGYQVPYTASRRAWQATSVTTNMTAGGGAAQPASASWQYIKKQEVQDDDSSAYFYGTVLGGSSSTFTRDAHYIEGTGTATGLREFLAFGTLGSGVWLGGLSFLLGTAGLSSAYWSVLGRLSPNGNRGEFAMT